MKAWLNGQELVVRIDTQNKRTIFRMNQTALEAEKIATGHPPAFLGVRKCRSVVSP